VQVIDAVAVVDGDAGARKSALKSRKMIAAHGCCSIGETMSVSSLGQHCVARRKRSTARLGAHRSLFLAAAEIQESGRILAMAVAIENPAVVFSPVNPCW
jgi:hypothetical protein